MLTRFRVIFSDQEQFMQKSLHRFLVMRRRAAYVMKEEEEEGEMLSTARARPEL